MSAGLFWGILFILIGISIVIRVIFNVDFPLFKFLFAFLFIWIGIRIMLGTNVLSTHSEGEHNVIFGENDGQERKLARENTTLSSEKAYLIFATLNPKAQNLCLCRFIQFLEQRKSRYPKTFPFVLKPTPYLEEPKCPMAIMQLLVPLNMKVRLS